MVHRPRFKPACGVAALGMLGVIAQGIQAEDLIIPFELPELNFAGLGFGAYPDYLGSSDDKLGAAPLARLSLGGNRFARVTITELRVNLVDDPNWRFGPMGLWRLGRSGVNNPVVDKLHEIDDSISLGAFGGYVWRDPREFRRLAGVNAWMLGDASGVYNGWTSGLSAYAMAPVAKMLTLSGGAAFTYASENYMDEYFGVTPADSAASGLPVYAPGSGVRDVRGWALAILHLSKRWHLGVGAMYMQLMDEAADSPIVSQEGSRDQWVYGAGFAYAWQ